MMKSPKKTTSKTTKKNGKTNGKPRKPNALHEKLIRLLSRPDGATPDRNKEMRFRVSGNYGAPDRRASRLQKPASLRSLGS